MTKKFICWVEYEEIIEAKNEEEALIEFEKGLSLFAIKRRIQIL